MKYIVLIALISTLYTTHSAAQFRGEEPAPPSVAEGFQRQADNGAFLNFLSLDRLEMRHSVSMSYTNIGHQGLGLTMYTNSLTYNIAEPLTVSADVSLMFSPFGTMSQSARDNLSGIYLRRASIDYAPSKDVRISLQYRNTPYNYFSDPFYDSYGFDHGLFSRSSEQDLR